VHDVDPPSFKPPRRTWLQNAKTAFGFGLVYLGVDLLLNNYAIANGWTIIWPLNGFTIALLLMRPRREWPVLLLGVEVGTGIGECFDDNTIGMEICQRFISLSEVLISACVLPPFSSLDEWLRKPRIFPRFLAALAFGPGISGVCAALLWHYEEGQAFFLAFNNWATADALGIAAIMPLALSLNSPQMRVLFAPAARLQSIGILVFACAAASSVFLVSDYPLLFLLYPVLLWVDSKLEFAGSAIVVVAVCLVSVFLTIHNLGPFGHWPANRSVPRDLALQIYFGFHIIALFPASVLFMERRRMAEELRDSNARLTVLAALDGLTGIANRRSFDERFAQEWQRAGSLRTPLTLALIDLDNFKQYNDLYGHLAGDQTLRAVGQVLKVAAERPEDFAARFGGEEFAMLLPNTARAGAGRVTERLRAAVLDLAIDHLGNVPGRATVSIGYATVIPGSGDTPARLIQLADAALYQAKRNGRNRVETMTLAEGLRTAEDQSTPTQRNRILRILGDGER